MGKNSASRKKSALRKGKGFLCAAFAAALLAGCGHSQSMIQYQKCSPQKNSPGAEPCLVQAFGTTARKAPQSEDPFVANWADVLHNQQYYMKNPADARQYNNFLASFNGLKSYPLYTIAATVNGMVESDITYSSTLYGQGKGEGDDYWAAPIETEMYHAGDCHDFSILQYFIMRHLGVPENRLFIANVSAVGLKTGIDHTVLLLNMAPAGQKQNFVVLNDAGPVTNANDYTNPNGANYEWPKPYVFYDARNQSGFWASKYTNYFGDQQVSRVVPKMKIG